MQSKTGKNKPRFFFIITNPNHHWENSKPLMVELNNRGFDVRLVSFCEMRRLPNPSLECKKLGFTYYSPFPKIPGTTPASGSTTLGAVNSPNRRFLYNFLFYTYLMPFFSAIVRKGDMVFHYNDVAFPGYILVPWFKNQGVFQGMLQEGIRFPLPNATADIVYGSKGVDILFCWGKEAKVHFEKIVASNTKVVISGSPRYQAIKNNFTNPQKTVLKIGFFTNPIDDQGYCSYAQKFEFFEQVIQKIAPVLQKEQITLLLKTHVREKIEPYCEILEKYQVAFEVGNKDIFNLIAEVKGGIIFASSVGLEMLYLGKNIAQVQLPGFGYVFDYVENQVALPIAKETAGIDIVQYLLRESKAINDTYLSRHLSPEMDSVSIICNTLINREV